MSIVVDRFYVPGGTLADGEPSYVPRKADAQLLNSLRAGKFCYVLDTRQVGKSSLMIRTASRLREDGVRVGILDLNSIGQKLTIDQWYRGLLRGLGDQLGLEDECVAFWDGNRDLGPLQRWMGAIRRVLLPHSEEPLVIFVDEIDGVRSLPFSTDEFFVAIRECYNGRSVDRSLYNLTFCLVGSAAPTDLIEDVRTTPFNIGQRIELTDFTEGEAAPLAKGLCRAGREGRDLLGRVLYWTGGHPYLTQRLCRRVADEPTATDPAGVDRVCATTFLSRKAQDADDNNLVFVRERMLKGSSDPAGLLDLYTQVRRRCRPIRHDDRNPLCAVLRLSGIVHVVEGCLQVRNRIYERVFDEEWVRANMPDAERQRQIAAYRRGVLRTAAFAGVILAAMGYLLAFAWSKADQAKEQSYRAKQQTLLANRRFIQMQGAREKADQAARETEKEAERVRAEKERASVLAQRASDMAERANTHAKRAKEEAQRAIRAQQEAQRAEEVARNALRGEREQRQEAVRLAGEARLQTHKAQKQTRLAQQLSDERVRRSYESDMVNVNRALRASNGAMAYELLMAHKERHDLRSFEWRYLWRLLHLDRFTVNQATGKPSPMVFLPDGEQLAAVSTANTLDVWDTEAKRRASPAWARDRNVNSLARSEKGPWLAATASNSGLVRLWDLSQGGRTQTIRAFPEGRGGTWCVALSQDGARMAAGNGEGTIKQFEVATGREIGELRYPDEEAGTKGVVRLCYDPSGKRLLAGYKNERLRVWDLDAGKPIFTRVVWEVAAYGATFDPDGKLAYGSDDDVVIYDLDRKTERIFRGHNNLAGGVAFTADGKKMASASYDQTIKIWDAKSGDETPAGVRSANIKYGRELQTLIGHFEEVYLVAFSPSSERLASAGNGEVVKIWDLDSVDRYYALRGDASERVSGLAFSPDSKRLASGSRDGTLRIRDPSANVIPPKIGTFPIRALDWSRDGKWIALGGSEGTTGRVALRDASGRQETRLEPPPGEARGGAVTAVAFSPNSRYLVTGTEDAIVRIWEVATRFCRTLREDASGALRSLALSPDGRLLVTGGITVNGEDGWLRFRDLTKQPPKPLPVRIRNVRGVTCVAFSRNGRRIVTGHVDKMVHTWDLVNEGSSWSLKHRSTYKGHGTQIFSVAFTPDGKRVASGGMDGAVKLSDMTTGEEILSLVPRERRRRISVRVAFSHDGRWLAASNAVETINLWVAATEKEVTGRIEEDRPVEAFRNARKAEESRDWKKAKASLDVLVKAAGENPALLRRRANALAEIERWSAALSDYRRAAGRRLDADALGYIAHLQLAQGDQAAFRRTCVEMLRHFGSTESSAVANNVAWRCVMVPGAVPSFSTPLRMARFAVEKEPNEWTYWNTLGAAEYRAGRWDDAIRHLDRAIKLNGQGGTPWDWLFLAMAYQRQNHPAQARQCLTRGLQMIANQSADQPWSNRLELRWLAREAQAAVGAPKRRRQDLARR